MSDQKPASKAVAPIDELRGTLTKMAPQFKAALPSHISVDRFVRTVQTALNITPALAQANRQSFFAAAMKSATDGLLPDGREAAFVTFNTKAGPMVQYMPMVQGILKKVRNSGELLSIDPQVVYENDEFDYFIDETGPHIKHRPNLKSERGLITHAYAIAKTKDGGTYIEVMSYEEVEQIRNSSRAKDGGPWTQWYGEMFKKSVIRRLAKRLPTSTDLEATLHADDEIFNVTPADAMPQSPSIDSAAPVKLKLKKSSRLSQAIAETTEVAAEPETDQPTDLI